MRLRNKIWSMVALLMVLLSAGCHRRPLEEMDDSSISTLVWTLRFRILRVAD
ncbi:MAG: hypothetical protein J6K24_07775 [Tidjanibacter sp.]|nr:hypothetical protein [Tidjanibacter sp.]